MVFGLLLVIASILGYILLPQGFTEVKHVDEGVRVVRYVRNPVWESIPFLFLAGSTILGVGFCTYNNRITLVSSVVASLLAFSPLIIPPNDAPEVNPAMAEKIRQDFYTHLDESYAPTLWITIKSNEGDADFYTFYYIKYAEYRKGEGLRSTNPLLTQTELIITIAAASYTTAIIAITSIAYTIGKFIRKIRYS